MRMAFIILSYLHKVQLTQTSSIVIPTMFHQEMVFCPLKDVSLGSIIFWVLAMSVEIHTKKIHNIENMYHLLN